MAYNDNNLVVSEHYNSLNAFVNTIENRDVSTHFDPSTNGDVSSERHGAGGTDTYHDAADLARYGWQEGLEMANKMVNDIGEFDTPVETVTNTMARVGAVFVPQVWLTGSKDYMYNPVTPCEKPVIKLVVNIGMLGDVRENEKIAKGVAIMALVARLERCGQRVELVAWKGTQKMGTWIEFSVVIKHPDQHIDMGILAYVFAHPSFQRRHNFKWVEGLQYPALKNYRHTYGATIHIDQTDGGRHAERDMAIAQSKHGDSTDPLVHYRNLKQQAKDEGLIC